MKDKSKKNIGWLYNSSSRTTGPRPSTELLSESRINLRVSSHIFFLGNVEVKVVDKNDVVMKFLKNVRCFQVIFLFISKMFSGDLSFHFEDVFR